jgi:hypothetical protein
MQRLDPDRRFDSGLGDRRRLRCLEPACFADLRIAGPQVTHHQRGRHRVVALAPHRRANRDHLAHHGFSRVSAAGYDGCDVVDLDTTGHRYSF